MKYFAKIFLISLALFLSLPAAAKLTVVATLPDFASIADAIGGERVETISLIMGTQDPHFVDAKPSMILQVNKADLLIFIGLDLEKGWLPVLITQSRNSKIQAGSSGYLDASQYITPKEVPIEANRAMGDVHSAGNPHYYTSPEELFKVSKAIFAKLIELDPEGKSLYEKNWLTFKTKYEEKSKEWKAKLAPFKNTKVIEYHKSWIYLIDWMGFESVGALEPKPGVPPSPSHVTRMLAAVKNLNVKYIFEEIYYPSNLSQIFAQKADAKLLILPGMVGGKEGADDFFKKFDYIVNQVTQN